MSLMSLFAVQVYALSSWQPNKIHDGCPYFAYSIIGLAWTGRFGLIKES